MGGFIRTWDRITSGLLDFMGFIYGVEKGEFCATSGQHEIIVPLSYSSNRIWVSISQDQNVSCGSCGGCNVNKVGYTFLEKEIAFHVDIKTDSCVIQWIAYR